MISPRRDLDRSDDALKPFSTFLDGTSARCGRMRDSQRDFLFHQDANEIGSAAMVPLGTGADGGPVFLADIWPSAEEIKATVNEFADLRLVEVHAVQRRRDLEAVE